MMYKIHVSENKGRFNIKSTGYDVLGIFNGSFLVPAERLSINRVLLLIEELFIISHLNDNVALEGILEIFTEDKWKHVAKMHGES